MLLNLKSGSKLGKSSERNLKKKTSGFNSRRYKKSRTTEVLEIIFKKHLWFLDLRN